MRWRWDLRGFGAGAGCGCGSSRARVAGRLARGSRLEVRSNFRGSDLREFPPRKPVPAAGPAALARDGSVALL